MACKAWLVKVNDRTTVKARLKKWTDKNRDKIISDVERGTSRIITDGNCEGCKADLERNDAAKVEIR